MGWSSWSPWSMPDAQIGFSASAAVPLSLRIISHNVRYATLQPFPSEQPWDRRAPLLLSQLYHETRFITVPHDGPSKPWDALGYTGGFICLQEVLHMQLIDIMAGLNRVTHHDGGSPAQGPLWSYVGVGRDDGRTAGEYSPIIYPSTIFTVLEHETIWLSDTPSRPRHGWDAASIRILNLCALERKGTRQRIIAANTHLDDQGAISRRESVKLILEVLERWHMKWSKKGHEAPGLFLAGDFNSKPNDVAYQLMNSSKNLKDAYGIASTSRRYGDETTFTGFEPDGGDDDIGRIDFIWLRSTDDPYASEPAPHASSRDRTSDSSFAFVEYAALPNVFDEGVYLSDHRAVVVDAVLGG